MQRANVRGKVAAAQDKFKRNSFLSKDIAMHEFSGLGNPREYSLKEITGNNDDDTLSLAEEKTLLRVGYPVGGVHVNAI